VQNKTKWTTNQDFKKFGGKGRLFNTNFGDTHYVSADPSEPPMTFQFRSESKDTSIHAKKLMV